MPSNADSARAARHTRDSSHILRGCQPAYHWAGVGLLSVKTFFGGSAHYRIGGTGACEVNETGFLVLNAGQSYSITIEAPHPVESFCLFFGEELTGSVWRTALASGTGLLDDWESGVTLPEFYERTFPHEDHLSPSLFSLRETLQRLPCGTHPEPVWVSERLCEVLERLLCQQGRARAEAWGFTAGGVRPATREETYRRLHRARDYMAACYAEPLTLEYLAGVACLSPNHFLRTFKAAFGRSPHQYLTDLRIHAACRQLRATDARVTDICLRVGFTSLGSFSHLFARRVGVSPEAYRKQAVTRQ